MNQKSDVVALSAEDLRERLYENLKRTGVLDKVKV